MKVLLSLTAAAYLFSAAVSAAAHEPPSGAAERIVGGQDADQVYPFMAALFDGDARRPHCGGTLIAPQWILTAGHCVEDRDTAKVSVHLGANDITTGDGERVEAAGAVIHPEYVLEYDSAGQVSAIDNDLALIKLVRPSSQQPARMVESSPGPRVPIRLIGWGIPFPDYLQQLDTAVQPDTLCPGNFFKPDKELCIGPVRANAGIGPGDSGSPALKKDADGNWHVVGTASRVAVPGSLLNGAIYTDTLTYRSWVDSTISR
ncbi:serine protease [Streptomyces sp. TRM66268-LWL]|uniref:Serine protease n=1 Tax=Streptomyces polyasparticus TaxID=2767826 RepID=A0ABR7SVR0_9ACTN|nr:serine protease [Streptomyces polyasparticus]MBC9719601.1 serine protease [Streptomyces polyasparticus]